MKNIIVLFALLTAAVFSQPVIDGTFDGESVWGVPIASADGSAGWAGANAKKIYSVLDANSIYIGAEVTASSWQAWAFLINTKTGGGSTESWSRSINYAHTNLPDFIVRGTLGGWCEFHTWNGAGWDGTGTLYSDYAENIEGNDQDGWIEVKILKSAIGNVLTGDIQFYLTGDNNPHATFDACPNDEVTTDWSGITTSLSNYVSNVILPVELISFSASVSGSSVKLNWQTATEVNNYGFEIQRLKDSKIEGLKDWEKIGFVAGNGNSNSSKSYSFTDDLALNHTLKVQYRLKQIDNDGQFDYLKEVEVLISKPDEFTLEQNYPNPFNPNTTIKFNLPEAGYVKLTLYNILGQEIRILLNESKEAGSHTLSFDANGLNSGTYIYKIESSSNGKTQIQTQKMTLLK